MDNRFLGLVSAGSAALVSAHQPEQSLRPDMSRRLAQRSSLEPTAAGRPSRVADATIGIVGALEPGGAAFDEGAEQRDGRGRILGRELARYLLQPRLQLSAKTLRFAKVVRLA
ncbi:hypothetical protein [Roseateles sp.]|uniref:hypothetical protein n=1 Tax=Roseateles sp. TaxID=1971397 RepID=UPI0025E937ED|nr:hypothetical protein [Roseateles sp.]MBV8037746.1 hypothetical protein [Roseateles sp.]